MTQIAHIQISTAPHTEQVSITLESYTAEPVHLLPFYI